MFALLARWFHKFVCLLLLFIFTGNPLTAVVQAAVYVPSGFYYYDTLDLALGGQYPLFVSRHYQSQSASGASVAGLDGPFGPGTHMGLYSLRAEVVSTFRVRLFMPTGDEQAFIRVGDGTYRNERLSDPIQGIVQVNGTTITLTMERGTVLSFTASGSTRQLNSIQDRLGKVIRFEYDPGESRIRKVIDPFGRYIQFEYQAGTNRVSVAQLYAGTDGFNDWFVSYEYDGSGNLVRFHNVMDGQFASRADGSQTATNGVTQYSYSGNALTTITGPRGYVVLTNSYDGNGRIIQQRLPGVNSSTSADDVLTTYSYGTNSATLSNRDQAGASRFPTTLTWDGATQNITQARSEVDGSTSNATYDPTYNLIATYKNALNQQTTWNYQLDSSGTFTRLSRIQQSDSSQTNFSFNGSFGRISSVTDERNQTTSFTYHAADQSFGLNQVSSPLPQNDFYPQYNSYGQPLRYQDGQGRQVTYTYNDYVPSGTDPNPNTRFQDLASITDGSGVQVRLSYDALSRLTSLTDATGNTWTYSYDRLGRVLQIIAPGNRTTRYTYDDQSNLTSLTAPNGVKTTYTYDALDRVASRTQNGRTESYGYNELGQLTSSTDPKGQVTSYTFDSKGRTATVTFNNQSTLSYSYNTLDQVTQITDSSDPAGSKNIAFSYSTASNQINRLAQVTTAPGTTSQDKLNYAYDAAGNLTKVTREAPPPQEPYGFMDYGNCQNAGGWAYDPDNPSAILGINFYLDGPRGSGTYFASTQTGLYRSDLQANWGFNFTYPTPFQDNRAHTVYAYAVKNGIETLLNTDPQTTPVCAAPAPPPTTLNCANYPLSLSIDEGNYFPVGNATFRWTAPGTPNGYYIRVQNAATGAIRYDSSLVSFTSTILSLSLGNYLLSGSVWLNAPNVIGATPDAGGSRCPSTTPIAFTVYRENRPPLQSPQPLVLQNKAEASLAPVVSPAPQPDVPQGPPVLTDLLRYSYKNDNSLASATLVGNGDGADLTVSFNYDASGSLTSVSYPNGLTGNYSYTRPSGSPNGDVRQVTFSVGSTGLRQVTYSYDYDASSTTARGYLTQRTESGPNVPAIAQGQQFSYNAVGELTSTQTTAGSYTSAYDLDGNPTAITNAGVNTTATYEAGSNRMTGFGGRTIQTDANGNITNDGINRYEWNARDELITIRDQSNNIRATFIYDALGRRIQKTVNGITTQFTYSGSQVIEEVTNGVKKRYLVGLGLDAVYASRTNGADEYLLRDALNGSIIAVVAGSNSPYVKTGYGYTPFGQVVTSSINTLLSADILWRNTASNQVAVWLMNGATFSASTPISYYADQNWQVAASGDLNQDGKTDILWRNLITGQNVAWLLDGTAYKGDGPLPTVTDLSWHIEGIADFNGDGKNDLLWRNYASGANSIWLMDGTTPISYPSLPWPAVGDLNWHIEEAADFTGDGQPDILWRNYSTGTVSIWVMNGLNFVYSIGLPIAPDPAWKVGGVGDFTGDGKTDILWRNYTGGDIHIWVMSGVTYTTSIVLSPVTDLNWQIASAGDFGGPGSVPPNNLTFTGREDDGTGLIYYRARYYSPDLQRFIAEDPLGFGGGDTNLYRYVGNTPHLAVDPSGLQQTKLSPKPTPRKQSNVTTQSSITAPGPTTNNSCGVVVFGPVTASAAQGNQAIGTDPPPSPNDTICGFSITIGVGGGGGFVVALPGQTVAAGGSVSYVPFTYFCNASTPCLPEAYIQLSLSGQPADWVQSATAIPGRTTYSFNPPNVFPSQQQSSTLTIRTDASTPPNTYNLTIGGTTINGPSGVRSMSTSLTVTPPTTPPNTPTITSVSSFSAQVGQTVTLTGNNLGNATQVWFGGVPAAFTLNVSTNTVTAAVPPNAPTAPISVVTASGTTQTAQNFMPTNVPTAPRRAQFDLGIAAQQLQQFYERNQDALQGTFSALGQVLNGGLTGILGLLELSGGAALLNYANLEDGSLSGAVAAAAAADLLAVGSTTVLAGNALVNQGVKGLFEQQYYAASQGGGQIFNVKGIGNLDLTSGGINNFISKNANRFQKKLGDKIGQGRLPFEKGRAGFDKALSIIDRTLKNPTDVFGPFTSARGQNTVIDIFSRETGFTVRIRADGSFDTLIPGPTRGIRP
ncbi:FG-GAP-like repeat-containing protein [Anthocerotibacter panamensis]|uniref:FG-GAP-like repeat-containing protein n=1 Tax=Anthocerotibacter panamensis TaxID=2857077 RepID=UPI001C405433|nr:FG-GAP-like repeat-containing protein [Anthocerotibacter panamensis]